MVDETEKQNGKEKRGEWCCCRHDAWEFGKLLAVQGKIQPRTQLVILTCIIN